MSYCREEGKDGKDRIVFVEKEDMSNPSKEALKLLERDEENEPVGAILPNGELNFSCPCVGSLHAGPCGFEIREFISCGHYSKRDENDPRGHNCDEKWKTMSECMLEHADYYGEKFSGDDDDDEESDPLGMTNEDFSNEIPDNIIDQK